ncbi:hypothetical protein C8R43DRAFT_1028055 [Mycena crocata]|nr:hypothetical protein C8R43DRAFT_1028055 [Mycena crocata]
MKLCRKLFCSMTLALLPHILCVSPWFRLHFLAASLIFPPLFVGVSSSSNGLPSPAHPPETTQFPALLPVQESSGRERATRDVYDTQFPVSVISATFSTVHTLSLPEPIFHGTFPARTSAHSEAMKGALLIFLVLCAVGIPIALFECTRAYCRTARPQHAASSEDLERLGRRLERQWVEQEEALSRSGSPADPPPPPYTPRPPSYQISSVKQMEMPPVMLPENRI